MASNEDLRRRLQRLEKRLVHSVARSTYNDSATSLVGDNESTSSAMTIKETAEAAAGRQPVLVTGSDSPLDSILYASRVYRRTQGYENEVFSLRSSVARTHAWSIFSGISLAEISNISVIALPIYASDAHRLMSVMPRMCNPQAPSTLRDNFGIPDDMATSVLGILMKRLPMHSVLASVRAGGYIPHLMQREPSWDGKWNCHRCSEVRRDARINTYCRFR